MSDTQSHVVEIPLAHRNGDGKENTKHGQDGTSPRPHLDRLKLSEPVADEPAPAKPCAPRGNGH